MRPETLEHVCLACQFVSNKRQNLSAQVHD